LRHFWPLRHDAAPLPEVLADKWRLVAPLARSLPGGYRFTPARDLIDEIEWAKSRRLTPTTYDRSAGTRTLPIPVDLFVRVFRDYEEAKRRRGLIDFDDILGLTVELLETDAEAAASVRARYEWFTVDEYQDTTPLQARLLELWLGDRRDLCVVGDEDQTIYAFAGATPEHLVGFAGRYPDAAVVPLLENYRSSPQVLRLANDLLASAGRSKRLVATKPDGPEPIVRSFRDDDAESAFLVDRVRQVLNEGVPGPEIAVLVRLNAQIAALEAAFTRAGIPHQVRGQRFFDRPDVKAAIRGLSRLPDDLVGDALVASLREHWAEQLGYDPDEEPEGREGRERHAALSTLLAIVTDAASSGGAGRDGVIAQLAQRAEREREGDVGGVELLTLHRAKGLEWDAVFIPSLEEGLLPVAQAVDDEVALAEEQRLLYVGITRARVHLALTWAQQRASASGRPQRRTMSRFLRALGGAALEQRPAQQRAALQRTVQPRVHASGMPADRGATRAQLSDEDAALFDALRKWRLERARAEKVSPFIVAYDSVLASIAEHRPRTEAELLAIPGIGPGKVAKYGEDILALVANA
jgi:DNA helicase-2/ATP-dependent DNA helicase PcrA